MEKIQIMWDKTKGNYRPPRISTKFFLLDPLDKLIALVDETPTQPDGEYGDDPEVTFLNGQTPIQNKKPKYKEFLQDNGPRKYLTLKRRIPYPFWSRASPNGMLKLDTMVEQWEMETAGGRWGRDPLKVINEIKYGKWLKVLEKLEEEKLSSGTRGPDHVDVIDEIPSVTEVIETKAVGEEGGSTNSEVGLIDMPLEVFEEILGYLDGMSVLNACSADISLDDLFSSALGTNRLKLWKFWRNTCLLNLNQGQMLQVLASYDGIVERQSRIHPEADHPFIPLDDPLDNNDLTWENICRSVSTLLGTLYRGKLEVKNMSMLENRIKTQILMNSKERPTKEDEREFDLKQLGVYNPTRITQTSGSIIYSLLSPWRLPGSQWNVTVMEGVDECEVRRLCGLCVEGVDYVKLMLVPRFKNPEDCQYPGLPRVARILVGVGQTGISFTPLQEGKGRQILFDDITNYTYRKMHPITAVHEDVIAVWGQPKNLKLYRCYLSSRGAEVALISTINLDEMVNVWARYAEYRECYIPTLVKKKVEVEEEDVVKKALRNPQQDQDFALKKQDEFYHELQMVSLRYGKDIISARNPRVNQFETDPVFVLMHQSPQYYMKNAKEFRESLNVAYCGAQGCGMFVVWNDKAVGISWDGLTWLFEGWEYVFDIKKFGNKDGQIEGVTHVEIVSTDCILVAVKGDVNILYVKKVPGQVLTDQGEVSTRSTEEFISTEPKLIVSLIRTIRMELGSVNLEIDTMTFEYDKGNPYILLIFKKIGSNQPIDFFIKRFCFIDEDGLETAEKRNEILTQKFDKPKKEKRLEGLLALDPKLFDLSSYPNVLKRLTKLQEDKANGIPIMKPPSPIPQRRRRYKGETRDHYYNAVVRPFAEGDPILF